MSATSQTGPLVAVIHRIPLFVEALADAFDGLATVQGIRDDDADLQGLLQVLRPDALIVESASKPRYDLNVPAVYVDVERRRVAVLSNGLWQEDTSAADLSPETIRNATLASLRSEVAR